MEIQNISFLVAVGAGILSFVSPCVFPMVPIYLGILSGETVDRQASRKSVFLHALFFVLGFSFVFIALGASVGLIGGTLIEKLPMLRIIAGILLVILGVHLLGIFKIPFLYREKRLINFFSKIKKNYFTSFLVGAAFSLGWTPCVGPILGGILVLASTSETVLQGALLLAAYSFGLGIPFLIIALCLSRASNILQRFNKYFRVVEIISGLLLIFIGVLISANLWHILSF